MRAVTMRGRRGGTRASMPRACTVGALVRFGQPGIVLPCYLTAWRPGSLVKIEAGIERRSLAGVGVHSEVLVNEPVHLYGESFKKGGPSSVVNYMGRIDLPRFLEPRYS